MRLIVTVLTIILSMLVDRLNANQMRSGLIALSSLSAVTNALTVTKMTFFQGILAVSPFAISTALATPIPGVPAVHYRTSSAVIMGLILASLLVGTRQPSKFSDPVESFI